MDLVQHLYYITAFFQTQLPEDFEEEALLRLYKAQHDAQVCLLYSILLGQRFPSFIQHSPSPLRAGVGGPEDRLQGLGVCHPGQLDHHCCHRLRDGDDDDDDDDYVDHGAGIFRAEGGRTEAEALPADGERDRAALPEIRLSRLRR